MKQHGSQGVSKQARTSPAQQAEPGPGPSSSALIAPEDDPYPRATLADVMRSPAGSKIWGLLNRTHKKTLRLVDKALLVQCNALTSMISAGGCWFYEHQVDEMTIMKQAEWAAKHIPHVRTFRWHCAPTESNVAALLLVVENAKHLIELDITCNMRNHAPIEDPVRMFALALEGMRMVQLQTLCLKIVDYGVDNAPILQDPNAAAWAQRVCTALSAQSSLRDLHLDCGFAGVTLAPWAVSACDLAGLTSLTLEGSCAATHGHPGVLEATLASMTRLRCLTLDDTDYTDEAVEVLRKGLRRDGGAGNGLTSLQFTNRISTSDEYTSGATMAKLLNECRQLQELSLSVRTDEDPESQAELLPVVGSLAQMHALTQLTFRTRKLQDGTLTLMAAEVLPGLPRLRKLRLDAYDDATDDARGAFVDSLGRHCTALEVLIMPLGSGSPAGFCNSLAEAITRLPHLMELKIQIDPPANAPDGHHVVKSRAQQAILAAVRACREEGGLQGLNVVSVGLEPLTCDAVRQAEERVYQAMGRGRGSGQGMTGVLVM